MRWPTLNEEKKEMTWLKKIINKLNCMDPFFWYWEMPAFAVLFVLFIFVAYVMTHLYR